MPERTVKLGSMFYIDEDGRGRRGDCGATVKVHPDHVERFDALNVLAEPVGVEFVPPIAPEAVAATERDEVPPARTRRK